MKITIFDDSGPFFVLASHGEEAISGDRDGDSAFANYFLELCDRNKIEITVITNPKLLEDGDVLFVYAIPRFNWIKIKNTKFNYKFCIVGEPEVVAPWMYRDGSLSQFDRIFTFSHKILGRHCNASYIPTIFGYSEDKAVKVDIERPIAKRVCQICSNKMSFRKSSNYRFRVQVHKFLEESQNNYCLFGVGWDRPHHVISGGIFGSFCNLWRTLVKSIPPRSWGGVAPSKALVLRDFDFGVCIENCCERGYLSCLIFEYFQQNVIPLFFGCRDTLDEFVPRDTYIWIDPRTYKTDIEYIQNLSEAEIKTFRMNIGNFMCREQMVEKKMSTRAVSKQVLEEVLMDIN